MNTYLVVSSFLNFLAALLLVFFVSSSQKRSSLGRNYKIFLITIAGWSLAYFLWRIATNESLALFYAKWLIVFSVLIPITFYHFSLTLSGSQRKVALIVGYVSAVALIVLTCFGYIVGGVGAKLGHEFWPSPGSLMPYYLAYYSGYLLLSGWILFWGWKNNLGERASDCIFVFFSGLVGFLGGCTNFPLWYDIPIQPYGNICVAFYILLVGYGLYSNRLSAINVDIYRSFVGLLLYTTTAILYLIAYVIYCYFIDRQTPVADLFLQWLSAFGVSAILFWGLPRLKVLVEKVVGDVFRSEKRSALFELNNLPMMLGDLADESSIAEITCREIMKPFEISGVAVFCMVPFGSRYRVVHQLGDFKHSLEDYEIDGASPLVEGMIRKPECLVLDQIYDDLSESYYQSLVQIHKDLQVSVVVPIYAGHEIYGFILLGETNEIRPWSEQEVSILFNIGAQIGLNLRTRDLERRSNEVDKLVALGTMAAGLAHEIRNPLVSVQTLASLVQSGRTLDSVSDDFKDVLLRDVKRIGNIVEGVALYSHNQESQKIPITLESVVRASLEIYQSAIEAAGVKLDFDCHGNSSVLVLGSLDQLMQVVNNLIENSLYALSDVEEPTLSIRLRTRHVRGRRTQMVEEVTVSDNGSGIPETILARIFDPFITSKDTGKRDEKTGMGLGLAISKRIIDNHDGRISAVNNEMGGAKFIVSLKVFDSKDTDGANE